MPSYYQAFFTEIAQACGSLRDRDGKTDAQVRREVTAAVAKTSPGRQWTHQYRTWLSARQAVLHEYFPDLWPHAVGKGLDIPEAENLFRGKNLL